MSTYLTVAIPYVNAAPHLGYAYELVQADVHARARRLAGDAVRFLGGTDDHSLKNVRAAEAAGVPVAELVNANSARFRALAGPLDLSFDDHVGTSTDPRHRPAVERLWRACAERGDLERRDYVGRYCVGCEQFYADGELREGRCPEHGTPVETVAERNWFFRLSAYQDHVEELVASDRLQIRPLPFREEVLAFVRAGLQDISVSRSVERARGWGVPVPDDPTQVVSVWFDALTNYLSGLSYGDPASVDHQRWWRDADRRVHVIGKGILRFHAVYWPAFLASAGEPPPSRVQVHPYLTVDGAKLSKTAGNGFGPDDAVAAVGTDGLRWWFARDVAPAADTDVTVERLVRRADADLANGLGNLVHRIATLVRRAAVHGVAPDPEAAPPGDLAGLPAAVGAAIDDFDLRGAADAVASAVADVNRELESTAPWTLVGDASPETEAQLRRLLGLFVAGARSIARAAEPIVPALSRRLTDALAADAPPAPGPLVARIGWPRSA